MTAAGRPEWLPEDWDIDYRVRNSGATAGTVDKYYKAPVSGKRFRSKTEVLHFLETGSKMKKAQGPDGDNMPSESTSTGARKRKNSASQSKEPAGFVFDFGNPPEKVTWTLEDAEEDRWSASIDGEKVPEATQKEWAAVFDHLSNHKP